jgi:hypothetical protein
MSRLAGELDREKVKCRRFGLFRKNRRNKGLKMKDISLDVSLVSSSGLPDAKVKNPESGR